MLKIPRFYIFISYVLQKTENVGGLHDEEDALVDVLEDGGQGDGADGAAEAPPVLLLVPAAPQRGHGRPQDDRVEADGNLRRGVPQFIHQYCLNMLTPPNLHQQQFGLQKSLKLIYLCGKFSQFHVRQAECAFSKY